jgi:hypothetical protein
MKIHIAVIGAVAATLLCSDLLALTATPAFAGNSGMQEVSTTRLKVSPKTGSPKNGFTERRTIFDRWGNQPKAAANPNAIGTNGGNGGILIGNGGNGKK